jgi:hypothetical protein
MSAAPSALNLRPVMSKTYCELSSRAWLSLPMLVTFKEMTVNVPWAVSPSPNWVSPTLLRWLTLVTTNSNLPSRTLSPIPGAVLPAPCAAGPLPVSVPVPVLLPALVPEPELPPSAAPMPARTKTKTTKPPMMPSVIFSPRCRFRGGCWWGAPGTDQDAPGGC